MASGTRPGTEVSARISFGSENGPDWFAWFPDQNGVDQLSGPIWYADQSCTIMVHEEISSPFTAASHRRHAAVRITGSPGPEPGAPRGHGSASGSASLSHVRRAASRTCTYGGFCFGDDFLVCSGPLTDRIWPLAAMEDERLHEVRMCGIHLGRPGRVWYFLELREIPDSGFGACLWCEVTESGPEFVAGGIPLGLGGCDGVQGHFQLGAAAGCQSFHGGFP
jgi:hypothetical protein